MSTCPQDFALYRYVADDCESDEQKEELTAHLGFCEECKAEVERLQQHVERYEPTREQSFQRLKEQLEYAEPQAQVWFSRRMMLPTIGLVATAAAAMLVVFWLPQPVEDEDILIKGQFLSKVYVKRGGQQFQAKEGDELRPGDRLRFEITTSGAGYLAIFSVDESGVAPDYYPSSPPLEDPNPWPIKRKGRQILPHAIELDSSSGDETIVVLFSEELFERRLIQDRILSWLQTEDSLNLSDILGFPMDIKVFHYKKAESN